MSRRSGLLAADARFKLAMAGSAWLVVLALVATAVFLLVASWPALSHFGPLSFFTSSRWAPSEATTTGTAPNPYGIVQFIYGTVLTSAIAMAIAVPCSVAIALFITEVVHSRARTLLSYLVDLLAAIPSVVYGFWGIFALIPAIRPAGVAVSDALGQLPVVGPFLAGPFFGVSYFTAGLVLAIMILPIVTAICREVFAVTPVEEKEAAAGLGATTWEAIRMAVLPRARAGILGAAILGLGRAFGETIAVTMLIGNSVLNISRSIFAQGATMPSVIANEFTEANRPFHLDSLFVVAAALLVLSLLTTFVGKRIVSSISETIG